MFITDDFRSEASDNMEDNAKDVELQTFAESSSVTEVSLHDSILCFENRDYLSMDSGIEHLNTSSEGNSYEEMKYDNTILPPPIPYDDVQNQTDSGVYENCPPGDSTGHTIGKIQYFFL